MPLFKNNKFKVSQFICLITLANTVTAAETMKLSEQTPAQSLLPMLGGLLAVLVLIFLLASMLKKFSSFNLVANHIKVIESQSLGSKEKLVIVEIQDRQLVLGVTPHSINAITELNSPVEKKHNNLSFERLMKQFVNPQKSKLDNFTESDNKLSTRNSSQHTEEK